MLRIPDTHRMPGGGDDHRLVRFISPAYQLFSPRKPGSMGESEKFWNSWKFRPGFFEVFKVFRVVQDKNLTLPFNNYYPNLKDSFIIAFIEIQVETLLWILKIIWTNNTKTHAAISVFLHHSLQSMPSLSFSLNHIHRQRFFRPLSVASAPQWSLSVRNRMPFFHLRLIYGMS